MLQAAGIGTDGAAGALRVAGLGLTYASVFRVWLEDDDPGLARTMAALDRRLRRGESTLGGLEQVHTAVSRFGAALQELARNVTRGRTKAGPPPPGPDRPHHDARIRADHFESLVDFLALLAAGSCSARVAPSHLRSR